MVTVLSQNCHCWWVDSSRSAVLSQPIASLSAKIRGDMPRKFVRYRTPGWLATLAQHACWRRVADAMPAIGALSEPLAGGVAGPPGGAERAAVRLLIPSPGSAHRSRGLAVDPGGLRNRRQLPPTVRHLDNRRRLVRRACRLQLVWCARQQPTAATHPISAGSSTPCSQPVPWTPASTRLPRARAFPTIGCVRRRWPSLRSIKGHRSRSTKTSRSTPPGVGRGLTP